MSTQTADPLECSLCHRKFKTKDNKRKHVIVVHQNAGLYRCRYCSKSSQCRLHVEIHERSHTGEQPFRCEICHVRFRYKSGLKVHHLDMHAEKKFRCEICGESFGSSYKLKLHLDDHSKFKCKSCGQTFGKRSLLKRHINSHSNERFECNQCEASYVHRRNLITHQKKFHSATQRKALGRHFAQGDDHEEHGESSERDQAAARGGRVLDEAERGCRTEDDRAEDDQTEDDPTTGLAPENGAFNSANLKLVFDLEYRAPD